MQKGETFIEDSYLIERFKAGDMDALASIVTHYRQRLVREAVFLLKVLEDAEEVVQDVFIATWNNRASIHSGSSLEPYLVSAVRNRSINKIKSNKKDAIKRQELGYINESHEFIHPFEAEELANQIEIALSHVPPAPRRAFIMQYMEGLSQNSIAEKQNISLQVVKNNTSQALKILRRFLQTVKIF
jgi:RNA polymerase sigma-70 factor, ECF subfamily